MFGFPITTTFTSFQGLGKKQSKKQAFKILRSKGFIKGRLSKRRPAEMPSSPGADLQFKDLAAASNSQSEIDWGISLLIWLRERLEVSMMLACKGSVGFSSGKKMVGTPFSNDCRIRCRKAVNNKLKRNRDGLGLSREFRKRFKGVAR